LPRFLGLDWDNNQLHVVAATTGRGGVHIEKAVVLQDDFSPKLARAEAVGQRLREALKAAGMTAQTAVACVGRDRVILKEVRYPQVPPAEEPALIRFQAMKEMTESADSLVIDYTAKGNAAGGERVAFAFGIRRDVPAYLQAVCKAAGIRLLALTPRGFGAAACLKRAGGAAAAEPGAVAVVTVVGAAADFSVVHGDNLTFTRSLNANGNLLGEVRRNLAVCSGQNHGNAVHAVVCAGGAEQDGLRDQLRQALTVPVHALNPFAKDAGAAPAGASGGFTAAVGLADAWARKAVPVNFLKPKEPVAAADPNRKRNLKIAVAVAVGLVLVVFACNRVLAARANELDDLRKEEERLEAQFKGLGPDAKHIQGLREWTAAAVSWLDEVYEVTARFPTRDGFLLTELRAIPRAPQAAGTLRSNQVKSREKYTGVVTLTGEARTGDERVVDALKDSLNDANHRATLIGFDEARSGAGKGAKHDTRVFKLKVDVVGQPSRSYTTRFDPLDPRLRRPAPAPQLPKAAPKEAAKTPPKTAPKTAPKIAPKAAPKAPADEDDGSEGGQP
jgi:Tfp pilus assembly PilM family ATPase